MSIGIVIQPGMLLATQPEVGGYLLDQYPAGIAYSLKVLSSNFSNSNLILAHRDSDSAELGFTQTEIEDGTLTSWGAGTNVRIKTLFDQSGNGHDITQTSSSDMPWIVEGGILNTISGNPTMRFSGDHISGAVTLASNSSSSAFYVARMKDDPSMISSNGPSGAFDMLGRGGASEDPCSFASPLYRFNGVAKPSVDSRPEILAECLNITNIIGVTGIDYGSNYSTYRLGGRTFEWTGEISSAIVFDSDYSANYDAIDSILNSLYSVY